MEGSSSQRSHYRRGESEALEDSPGRPRGDLAAGVAEYEKALAIYRELGSHQGEEATIGNIGGLYYDAGDTARAAEYRKQAAALRAQYGLPPLTQRVSGGVLTGKTIRKVQPAYPDAAKQAGVEGNVVVEVTVSTDGTVESARALSGPPELVDASVAAARAWTFAPTKLRGAPIRMIGTITFSFRKF